MEGDVGVLAGDVVDSRVDHMISLGPEPSGVVEAEDGLLRSRRTLDGVVFSSVPELEN